VTFIKGRGIGFALIGLSLFVSSLMYCGHDARLDVRVLRSWHKVLSRKPWVTLFRWMWPLGTAPVGVVWLLLLSVYNLRLGLITSAVLGVAMIVETAIKRIYRRPRPFETLTDVHLLQPSLPRDPSFPSGDALRIWFLALVVPIVVDLGNPLLLAMIALITSVAATLVSLGRLALGVHYPSDVIAGAGLGFIATGAVIFFLTLQPG